MKNSLLTLFLFCSAIAAIGQIDTNAVAKGPLGKSGNPTHTTNDAPKDTVKKAAAKAKADSTARDTVSCAQLVLAKYYEKEDDEDKALAAYQEAVKCAVAKDRREAIIGVERTSKRLNGFGHKSWEKFVDWGGTVLNVLIPLVIALLLLFLFRFSFRFWKWLWGYYRRGKFVIDIQTFTSSTPGNEEFVTKLFKKLIHSNLTRLKTYQAAKQELDEELTQTAKPTIRSTQLNGAWDLAGEMVIPSLMPLFPKIYEYLWPTDFTISGFIFKKSEKLLRLNVEISGKETQKNWEITVDNSFRNLNMLCLEIVLYLNSKVEYK